MCNRNSGRNVAVISKVRKKSERIPLGSSLFSDCDRGGVYVNEYCSYFVVRFISGVVVFKDEITKSARNDYSWNCTQSILPEHDR